MALSKRMNNKRRFSGDGPRPDNLKHKQDEAKERQEFWSKLSAQEKLNFLDRRPGEAKKQRARILAQVEAAKKPAPAPKKSPAVEKSQEGARVKAKDRRDAQRQERPSK